MNIFLIHVNDADFCRLLPADLGGLPPGSGRVRIMAFPPLGIQVLAPILRERGHRARLFDTCHPLMQAPHVARAMQEESPDAIGLSFLSATTYPAAKDLAQRLRSGAPDTPIIAGGPFATENPEQILRDCPAIDGIGVGEGEELLPDYLEHLTDPGAVAGLVWRHGNEIVRNAPRPLIQDLDRFPFPDRTSLPIDYIESLPLDVPAVLSLDPFCTVQTSRGCPFSCVYCDIPSLSGGKWRHRSATHVLGELQQLHDQGYRSIYLTDDHFLLNRQRINDICRGIIDRGLEFHWGCEGRVDSGMADQLPVMKQAHCTHLAFGVEAGAQKVLERLGKRQTLAQVERAVSDAKDAGIDRVHGFFVIGCPDETVADIRASFRFAARLRLDTFGFNRLCVYRGTPLWREYVQRGIIDDARDWHKWFKCTDIDPTTVPSEVVNRLRMRGYAMLFARRVLLRPLQSYRLMRTFGRHMKLTDIVRMLWSPFRRRTMTRRPELPGKMLDAGLLAPDRTAGRAPPPTPAA